MADFQRLQQVGEWIQEPTPEQQSLPLRILTALANGLETALRDSEHDHQAFFAEAEQRLTDEAKRVAYYLEAPALNSPDPPVNDIQEHMRQGYEHYQQACTWLLQALSEGMPELCEAARQDIAAGHGHLQQASEAITALQAAPPPEP